MAIRCGVTTILGLLLVVLPGCAPALHENQPAPTLSKLPASEAPPVDDDGDQTSLREAISASIAYWQKIDPAKTVAVCGGSYHPRDFLLSLQTLEGLLSQLPHDQLPTAIGKTFDFCQPQTASGGQGLLVTGYYQPRFKASRTRRPPFIYPLYQPPKDLVQAQVFADTISQAVGRIAAGRFLPYWSRAEIESKNLLQGNELCYLADPVDVFLLQVQGSGLLDFDDGTVLHALFAGTNGRDYRSIGRLLADEGRMPLAEITLPRIRQYLHEHLDERQRILHYNERYVFFHLEAQGPGQGPRGSMGAVLTPGRSVALDPSVFPLGALYFLSTERPSEVSNAPVPWQPLTRLVLNQDTGAAIQGRGRLDFFWGSGEYPERAAGLMKQPGQLYLLLLKGDQS